MVPQPLTAVVRSPSWRRAVALLLVGVAFAFHNALLEMVRVWFAQADYSHGFLVPFVAAYILHARRAMLPPLIEWPEPWGLLPLFAGAALSTASATFNIAKEFGQGIGFILALAGVVLLALGRPGLRWALPGLAFLVFMVKLPDRIEILFTFKLRQVATDASNFLLQTLGYPSYVTGPGGTVITVGDVRLGVEWACSGLSMVLTFVAMGAAFALLMTNRPIWDRVFVFVLTHPSVPKTWFLHELDRLPDDRDRYLLKPLFSFAGGGIIFAPTDAQIAAIPMSERKNYILQERINFTPLIETPEGPAQAEIRIMYVFDGARLRPVLPLLRMGRGKMMGVDHNKGLRWVGASAGFMAE